MFWIMCEYVAKIAKQRWKWVSGSWVTANDPLTHDEITQYHYHGYLLLFSSTTGHYLAHFVLS